MARLSSLDRLAWIAENPPARGRVFALHRPERALAIRHGRPHDRLRPRRHPDRYRARSRRYPQCGVRARGPAAGALRDRAQPDRRRRPGDDRARHRGGGPRRRAGQARADCSPISSRTIPSTSPTARGPFPGSIDALDALAGRRLPLCRLHQQARTPVGAAAQRSSSLPTVSRRSAGRTRSACKSRIRKCCAARSRPPAATCNARS